jgi:phospholipid/cholesterol/gamma-HCH transport system ATP-binding protein
MITIRDVHKRFGTKPVLEGVSLEIAPGETLVILGRSGTGKSVLLKLLCGLMRADKGSMEVDGIPVNPSNAQDLKRLRGVIQMLFQGGALFDSLTVEQNVSFYAIEHGQTDLRRAAEFARPYLEMVDLTGTGPLKPSELSGGMRKRAALARALATNPKVMLYDEPTTGLDPQTSQTINELVRETQRRLGVTSVVVTHDLKSAQTVGDRCSFLSDGRIVETTSVARLAESSHESIREFVRDSGVAF